MPESQLTGEVVVKAEIDVELAFIFNLHSTGSQFGVSDRWLS